jgi:membrane-bound ClpP family serine protease
MFLLAVLLLIVVDLVLVVLSRLWPEPFLGALLVYGLILGLIGLRWFRRVRRARYQGGMDWAQGRRALLLVLLGAVCVAAFFPMFNSIRQEKQTPATAPQGGGQRP